jgi:hypothetical protein
MPNGGSSVLFSVTLCEGQAYEKRRVVLFKRVEWPSVPREGESVFFGLTDDGEEPGTSARIGRIYWSASGEVSVEAEADQLRDEYDVILADTLRGGFTEDVPDA